jgi:hypothetical protein
MVTQCTITESPNPGHIWPQIKHDFHIQFWSYVAKLPRLERNWDPVSKIWIVNPKFLSRVVWEAQHTFDMVFLVSNGVAKELITYPHGEVAAAMDQPEEPPPPPPLVEQPGLF